MFWFYVGGSPRGGYDLNDIFAPVPHNAHAPALLGQLLSKCSSRFIRCESALGHGDS
jgi:hypothetical protein